ncbi:MAG: DUF1801 domain-containing protein [Chloroflexi bacterium]|nr:DUF1801 domain-containing protein [Chloroflexota bacterium]
MTTADTSGVDAYLERIPVAPRAALEELRGIIRTAAPDAVETIAYDMPAYRLDGSLLISFAAYRRHCSLFPASQAVVDACGGELQPYISGKATIQFTAARPLPAALTRKIVEIRVAELRARGTG